MTNQVTCQRIEAFPRAELDATEQALLKRVFESAARVWNTTGPVMILDDFDWQQTLLMAEICKADFKLTFEAMPSSGFGARPPVVDDLLATAQRTWDDNWTTAGARNWINDTVPDTGTYDIANQIYLRDANSKKWAFIEFGIISMHPSPKAEALLTKIEGNDKTFQVLQWLRFGNMGLSKFPTPFLIPPAQGFKQGFQIESTGDDILMPLGLIFATNERFKAQTTLETYLTRPATS